MPLVKAAGVAVLIVSARDATEQKVAALDLGADDYVTKPFDTEEVLARIRTALRHRLSAETEAPVVLVGDIEIDLAARLVRRAGEEVHLTPKEFGFLAELAKHPGRVVTHAQLLRTVWGTGPMNVIVEYLRVAARGVRRKLEGGMRRRCRSSATNRAWAIGWSGKGHNPPLAGGAERRKGRNRPCRSRPIRPQRGCVL